MNWDRAASAVERAGTTLEAGLRVSPMVVTTIVVGGRDGSCVQTGPQNGSYYPVRCGNVEAWLHQKCVRD